MANKNKIKFKKIKFKKIPVSVELYNNSIKLAGGVFSKKGPIFSLIKKEFFSKENNDIFKEIAYLFRIHKFPSKSVFLNIPRHLVMARLLHLPSTSDDEIRNMVKMESAKQMPYRDEDIIIGYKIIEKLKNGYSDVLLAIAQEGIIKRLINILRGADLTIEKIILGSESLFGWYSVIRESRKEK
ncbi:MAG: hypothetical protein KAU58_05420, partial [Candidatus Omnitrophica bacterium]|nr:hypothetical protein [Candidatus Omnitrophota bacterium]